MEEIIPILREGLTRLGLPNAERAAEMLGIYARRLTEYNEKVNLTAITDPKEIATKLFGLRRLCAIHSAGVAVRRCGNRGGLSRNGAGDSAPRP